MISINRQALFVFNYNIVKYFDYQFLSLIIIYLQDKGPVFYSQERTGLNGKTIYRRIMIKNKKI